MSYDRYGQYYCTSEELCKLLYRNPELDVSRFQLSDAEQYNRGVQELYADLPRALAYVENTAATVEEFDRQNQQHWHMPDEYQQLDIAAHILSLCGSAAELQRVAEELLLYQERDLFNLLRYLKYLVDTMRANGVVWGVGRGSSVASHVLYLLGVHHINSMYYDLDIAEFLK